MQALPSRESDPAFFSADASTWMIMLVLFPFGYGDRRERYSTKLDDRI
jgi:hypothetical protein